MASYVKDHLRYARVCARRWRNIPNVGTMDDRTQVCALGLLAAERLFDPSKGIPFEAFAFAKTRYALLDQAAKDQHPVREIPTDFHSRTGDYDGDVGRSEVDEESSRVARQHLKENRISALGRLSGHEEVVSNRVQVKELLKVLPAKLRKLLSMRFGLGRYRARSQSELARLWGVSRQAIHQQETQALALLREAAGLQTDPNEEDEDDAGA